VAVGRGELAQGIDVQSDIGLNYGWIMIGLGAVTLVAPARAGTRFLVGCAVAAVLVSGYAALTAASHTTSVVATDINGNSVGSDLGVHVSLAYGVVRELLAALVLLVCPCGYPAALTHKLWRRRVTKVRP